MNTQEIFEDFSTAELLSFRVMGDNSKELTAEILGRASLIPMSGNKSNLEIDAKCHGGKVRL